MKIVNAGTCDGKVDPAAAGGSDVVIPHAGRLGDMGKREVPERDAERVTGDAVRVDGAARRDGRSWSLQVLAMV